MPTIKPRLYVTLGDRHSVALEQLAPVYPGKTKPAIIRIALIELARKHGLKP
jgi:hypothetical protein